MLTRIDMDVATGRRWRAGDWLACAAPLAVIVVMLATYLVSPDFYLRYILAHRHREYQAVELATVACLAVALPLLIFAAIRLWRIERADPAQNLLHRHGASIFLAGMALATLLFLGEEINWGQNFVRWSTASKGQWLEKEMNLHNNVGGIPMQTLGALGLCAAFFGFPLLWAMRHKLKVPRQWRPAVAEGPVMVTLALAFVWKWFKELYIALAGKSMEDRFYRDFVDQINEHKELLVAMSLMFYGLYRIRAVRSRRLQSATETPHADRSPEPAFSAATRA